MTTRIALILLVLATASSPALARHYRHHGYGGNYNYGGPHYAVSDFYHNSRQLVGTR